MRFSLRRGLVAIGLLLAACGGNAAYAGSCTGGGSFTITVTSCPVKQVVRHGSSVATSFGVTAGKMLPHSFYVVLSGDVQVVSSNSLHATLNSSTRFYFSYSTPAALTVGKHAGKLILRVCNDAACGVTYATATIPYEYDVDVPPSITHLSPRTVPLGSKPFTLTLNGHFTPDCKIHVGSKAMTTKFVSASELTATVNLTSVPLGENYRVTVRPSNGLISNAYTLTLLNPVPVVTALSPMSIMVAGDVAPPVITVTGTAFLPNSKVNVNGMAVSTQYISGTEVIASPPGYPAVNPGSGAAYDISVTTPGPGGGTSGDLTFTVLNNAPTITSLSPSSILAGNSLFLQINGSGLQGNGVVTIGGVSYPVGGIGSSSVILSLPAGTLPTGTDLPVTVTNPAPGGGTSNVLTLEVDNPAPSVQWISPVQAYAGSGDIVLTMRVSGYNPSSTVEWNGTSLQGVTSVTANLISTSVQFLQVTVPAAYLATAGTATVAMVNPAPGGGTAQATFAVIQHPPEIDSVSPGFIGTGGGDLTLTLDGQDFDPSAIVYWNGDQLAIDSISATQIQVTVPAVEVAGPAVAKLTVVNPAAAGGASLPASFAVDDSGTAVVSLAQQVNDLAWDAARAVFYVSIPFDDATHPKSIATVDPTLAGIVATTSKINGTSNPTLLSVSGDGRLIYISGSSSGDPVLRYALPAFTFDQDVLWGGLITTLQVSPRFSHVVAVNQAFGGATPPQPELIMDGLLLVNAHGWEPWDAVAWTADGSHLYAGDNTEAGNDLVSVDFNLLRSVIATATSTPGVWKGTDMHLDQASGLMYADYSAKVIDPEVPKLTSAVYPVSGVMIPDSSLGCAYFITQTAAQVTAGANDYTLSCYSTTDQSLTRSLVIPAVVGTPTKMMRWGNEGLAFITDAGYIYFVSGQVVTGS